MLEPEPADVLDAAMSSFSREPTIDEYQVDWSFLDTDNGQSGDRPEWVIKMMGKFPPHIADDIAPRHRWSRPIEPATGRISRPLIL